MSRDRRQTRAEIARVIAGENVQGMNEWPDYCHQAVYFVEYDKPSPCWAHSKSGCEGWIDGHCTAPKSHGCDNAGTGRLGLCPQHEKGILG